MSYYYYEVLEKFLRKKVETQTNKSLKTEFHKGFSIIASSSEKPDSQNMLKHGRIWFQFSLVPLKVQTLLKISSIIDTVQLNSAVACHGRTQLSSVMTRQSSTQQCHDTAELNLSRVMTRQNSTQQ